MFCDFWVPDLACATRGRHLRNAAAAHWAAADRAASRLDPDLVLRRLGAGAF